MTRQDIDDLIRLESKRIGVGNGEIYKLLYNEFGKAHDINLWREAKAMQTTKMKVLEHYNLLSQFHDFAKSELSWR